MHFSITANIQEVLKHLLCPVHPLVYLYPHYTRYMPLNLGSKVLKDAVKERE